MSERKKPQPASVGVIGKVLRILELLKNSSTGLSARRIGQETNINRSTVYRFVEHLVREGYLARDNSGVYRISEKLSEFGACSDRPTLRDLSQPVLRELWEGTQETVNLAVLDGTAILFLLVIESPSAFRLASSIGMRGPLHSSSLGKAILAFLPPEEKKRVLMSLRFRKFTHNTTTSLRKFKSELDIIRHRGYSLDNEETYLGVRAVGVPILNERMEAVASISVTGPVTRLTPNKIPSLAKKVRQAARVISARVVL